MRPSSRPRRGPASRPWRASFPNPYASMSSIPRKQSPWSGRPLTIGLLGALLTACSGQPLSDKVDYRKSAAQVVTLDVPPDLSQLSPDSRFGMPNGEPVLASQQETPKVAEPSAAAASAAIAPNPVGNSVLMRRGEQRWILSKDSPESLWPRLEKFVSDNGLNVRSKDPQAGVIETDWAENRSSPQADPIRATLGRVFSFAYDSGLRDRYTARVERAPEGTEVYLVHHGLEEVYVEKETRTTRWQPRASDPALEAIMLQRLLVQLGADPQAGGERIESRPVARLLSTGVSTPTLEIDDSLANTWRRVSVALDRSEYATFSRDRRKAILTVSLPVAKQAESKGFLSRLFSSDEAADPAQAAAAPRQRLMFEEPAAGRTRVSVLDADGQPDTGERARALADWLLQRLN